MVPATTEHCLIDHLPFAIKLEDNFNIVDEVLDNDNYINTAMHDRKSVKILSQHQAEAKHQELSVDELNCNGNSSDTKIYSILGKVKNNIVYFDIRDTKTKLQINVELLSKDDQDKIRHDLTSNMEKWNEFLEACKHNELDNYAKIMLLAVFGSELPDELKQLKSFQ